MELKFRVISSENLGITRQGCSLFLEFRKRHWKFPEMQTGIFLISRFSREEENLLTIFHRVFPVHSNFPPGSFQSEKFNNFFFIFRTLYQESSVFSQLFCKLTLTFTWQLHSTRSKLRLLISLISVLKIFPQALPIRFFS